MLFRSDTDSGRSSAPGDAYSGNDTESTNLAILNKQPIYATSLKVIRRNAAAAAALLESAEKPVLIGGIDNKSIESPLALAPQGHVRKRKEEILRKKQQMVRRNTVAVNSVDVDRALLDEVGGYETVGVARSSNCLDRLGVPALPPFHPLDGNGSSMPGNNLILN